jgi:hypothetical protein
VNGFDDHGVQTSGSNDVHEGELMISTPLSVAGRALRPVTLAVFVLAAGCDPRTGPEPDPPLPTSCADPGGREYAGPMPPGHFVWRAADGPHRLVETVELDSLTIEAGALVCGGPDAEIRLGYFSAVGSADAPIVLTAADPARPWGGIDASRPTLSNVMLDHATRGLRVRFRGTVRNSLLRQIRGSAIVVREAELDLIETVIDSSCLAASAGCFAVTAGQWSSVRFDESQIRHSGGGGLRVDGQFRGAHLTLSGGTIEGSAGIGLHVRTSTFERAVRITGGASYPAQVSLDLAAAHTATPELQEMWSGNASDTVVVLSYGGNEADSVTIRPGLVWVFQPPIGRHEVRALVLEPGGRAVFTGSGQLRAERLVSEGTADEPVEFIGSSSLAIVGETPGPSRVVHTRFMNITFTVGTPGFVGRDLVLDSSRVRLNASNIRIERMRQQSGQIPVSRAALEITGDEVTIDGCEVTGSNRAGIRVLSGEGIRINNCNIHGHQGVGLDNLSAAPVDARNNWWGDPAGPHGPEGSGVSGNVLYEPWLTEPVPADRLPRTGDDR